MKLLLLFAISLSAFAQCGPLAFNPTTGVLNCTGTGGGGGSTAFSSITAGTNAAALVIGTGGGLTVSGSGTINSTSLGGTAAASYALLAGPTFTGTVTTAAANLLGTVGIGPGNTSPTGTLYLYDATASTGATVVTIAKGASQNSAANTLISDASATFLGTVIAGELRGSSSTLGTFGLYNSSAGSGFSFQRNGDGIILITNAAETSFGRLQFGGTTTSFPALKRSAAKIQVRLADDSAAGTFEGKYNSSDGSAGVTVTTCTGFKDGLCISGT